MIRTPPLWKTMTVALGHDWLTGMRGGERVLELLCKAFPTAPLYTLLYNRAAVSEIIQRHPIVTSWLQHLPQISRYYRYALPLFPHAVGSLRTKPADLLITTSHCAIKGLHMPPGTRHLSYCFTPMRYAWVFYGEYFGRNPLKKQVLKPILRWLREWDLRTCEQVDYFVTLSRHVQDRIRTCYQREADVVYPPVNTEYWTPATGLPETSLEGLSGGTFDLIVSALVPYKRIDLAVKAYTRLNRPLVIVGTGTEHTSLRRLAGSSIRFAGWRQDPQIRELYRHCRALIFPGEEDFGIVPVEAQACGRPVVAYGKGGVTETVIEGQTGLFFQEQTEEALIHAIERVPQHAWNPTLIRTHAERFGAQAFIDGLAGCVDRCLAGQRK